MALSSTVVNARDPALPRLQVILVSEGNIVTILTSEELLSQCMMNQKNVIYGDVRSYSCWECDMHVSDESWLYKHLAGEKHRWVKKRVDQRLPVFWEPQQIVSVQRVRDSLKSQDSLIPKYFSATMERIQMALDNVSRVPVSYLQVISPLTGQN